jgi:hypothetical protein
VDDGIADAVIDQRRIEPEHTGAAIAAHIRCVLTCVRAAIYLDDEPRPPELRRREHRGKWRARAAARRA